MPYGLAGIIFGASIVFFAYIGFDAISTHAEEAKKPQRDVPIAILASLVLCTVLYIGVAAVITGMVPYPKIDPEAAVAAAFTVKGLEQNSPLLLGASALIAIGRPGRHDQRAADHLPQPGAHLPGHGPRPSVAARHLRAVHESSARRTSRPC